MHPFPEFYPPPRRRARRSRPVRSVRSRRSSRRHTSVSPATGPGRRLSDDDRARYTPDTRSKREGDRDGSEHDLVSSGRPSRRNAGLRPQAAFDRRVRHRHAPGDASEPFPSGSRRDSNISNWIRHRRFDVSSRTTPWLWGVRHAVASLGGSPLPARVAGRTSTTGGRVRRRWVTLSGGWRTIRPLVSHSRVCEVPGLASRGSLVRPAIRFPTSTTATDSAGGSGTRHPPRGGRPPRDGTFGGFDGDGGDRRTAVTTDYDARGVDVE